MKNNVKGFTLIELLAAIVILGIISVFAIPQIVGLLRSGRNKVYISDAQKLITQAEYKMRANNSIIEKPEINDCIIISLAYLDVSDFDNAPNGGKYQKNKSFVIVKNEGSNFEYAVKLVEKTKRGYYLGIDLISQDSLTDGSKVNHVSNFLEDELIDVGTDITKEYINQKIPGYLSGNITNIYADLDTADYDMFDDSDG